MRRWGPWMQGTIVGHGSDDHKGKSYKIKSDRDWTHNYWDEETYVGHPNICGRIPQEGEVKTNKSKNIINSINSQTILLY